MNRLFKISKLKSCDSTQLSVVPCGILVERQCGIPRNLRAMNYTILQVLGLWERRGEALRHERRRGKGKGGEEGGEERRGGEETRRG